MPSPRIDMVSQSEADSRPGTASPEPGDRKSLDPVIAELASRSRELEAALGSSPGAHEADAVHAAVARALAAVVDAATLVAGRHETGTTGRNGTAANPSQARGALRFRDVSVLSPLPESTAESAIIKPKTVLPALRSAEDRPYTRPFVAKFCSGDWLLPWESAHGGGEVVLRSKGRLVLLAACAVVMALMGAGIYHFTIGASASQAAAVPPARPGPGAFSASERMGRNVFDARPEIERTIRGFHDAKTPEEKTAFIRGGETLLPMLRTYYASHPPEPSVLEFLHDTFNWIEISGRPVVYGLLKTTDESTHQFTVELTPEGCQLDWQAHTGWRGTDWSDFLERRSNEPVTLCVTVTPDTLFVGPYSDEREWICFRVEDISRKQPAWAYVRRNGQVAQDLPASFRETLPLNRSDPRWPGERRMTVELRFPHPAPQSAAALLEMSAVHHDGWFDPTLSQSRP